MALDLNLLRGRWVHSREEDTSSEQVYRPRDYPFPPARGRESFEIGEGDSYVEHAIGPVDRSVQRPGHFQLVGNALHVSLGDTKKVLNVSALEPGRLVIAR